MLLHDLQVSGREGGYSTGKERRRKAKKNLLMASRASPARLDVRWDRKVGT